jgi:catechol 2,3-dioxygenase-like lactoylglutathione lyase family enzyme
MSIVGTHHVSFSVTDLEKTVDFYQNVLGLTLRSRSHNEYDGLGTSLFGTKWGLSQSHAALQIAVMELGATRVEFIQYDDPAARPYHMNPSIAGSSHLAIRVKGIEAERERLEGLGVEFHAPINVFEESGKPAWKWCYFRDPDGICLELVESDD